MGKLKKKIENKVFGTKEERAYKKQQEEYYRAPSGRGDRNRGLERSRARHERGKGEHEMKKRERMRQWVESERAKKYPAASAAGKKKLAAQKMAAPPT